MDTLNQTGGSAKGYTTRMIAGCKVIYGSVPVSDFTTLLEGCGENAVVALDIADLIGATLVIGTPADINEMRKMELQVSDKRHADYLDAMALGIPKTVAMWLRRGERGASSESMCKRMYGVPASARGDHPHDPDDLRRCLMFLAATNSHQKMVLMKDVSEEWARLESIWSQLAATYKRETGEGLATPLTYALMRDALYPISETAPCKA